MGEPQTFLFADLAGFTAMTEAHGDQVATDMCAQFTATVSDLTDDAQAVVIKTIGDEVMIRAEDPVAAIRLGHAIVERLAHHGSPPVRVGMHTGPAVERSGDWFGSSVNLASRVAGAGRPGEVLLTQATASALPAEIPFEIQPRGARWFKHIPDPVPVFAAIGNGQREEELEIDPVCRMAVDLHQAAESAEHRGNVFHFCSVTCADSFRAEPRRYVGRSRRARAARIVFRGHLRVFVVAQVAFILAWAVAALLGGPWTPWFLLIAVGWGIPLALHFKAVREVL